MLYFEAFLGNGNYTEQSPIYTYQSWATRLLGPNGWDAEKNYLENLDAMISTLTVIATRVQKSIQTIGNVIMLNNLQYIRPVYTYVPRTQTPIYTMFYPYLLTPSNADASYDNWATYELPQVYSGSTTRNMTIMEGFDYLLKVSSDISITKSNLSLIRSMLL